MNSIFKFYDSYNFRARISTGIILLAPIIFPMYLLVPEVRELSSTVIIILICFGLCNIIISCSRTFGGKAKKKCFPDIYPAQQMLLPSDSSLDGQSKQRYQQFFINHLDNLSFTGDNPETISSANTAVRWLISRTRDSGKFPLIFEENTNFGFSCNLYGLKSAGITICITMGIIESTVLIFTLNNITSGFSVCTLCISLFVSICFLIMWIFLITKSWVQDSGIKYARALLSACDSEYFDEKAKK